MMRRHESSMAANMILPIRSIMETTLEQLAAEDMATYSYGVRCCRCKKPLICGYVQLGVGAKTEDLRGAKGLLGATGQYVTCEAFDPSGEVCGESTFLALSAVVLIDD